MSRVGLLILLLFCSCQAIDRAKNDERRKQNAVAEYITRKADEKNYDLTPPQPKPREYYPWEKP